MPRPTPELLQHVVDGMAQGLAILDGDGRVTYLNPAGLSSLRAALDGTSSDDLLGRTWEELLPHLKDTDVGRGLRAVLEGEETRADFRSLQGPTGRFWDLSIRPLASGVFVTFQKLTEAERADSRGTLALIRHAIDSVDAGVTIADARAPDLPLIFSNAGFTRLTGYPPDEVRGRNCRFLQGEDTDPAEVERIQDALARREPIQTTLLNYRRDGTPFWNRISLSPVRDHEGEVTHLVGIQEDVTERRRMGRQMGIADRLNSVGSLAGGIAHDMRNVLAGAKLLLQLVLAREDLPAEAADDLQEADEVLSRGVSVTSQLLAFAREQPLQRRTVDMGTIVRDRAQFLRRFLRDDIAITVNTRHDLFADLDEGRLDQVIFNLATNAEQAMPEGGTLRFDLRDTSAEAVRENVASLEDAGSDGYIVMSVEDTGLGMDEAVRARAFDPFFTGRPEAGGTGLGLASVFGTMDQLGGAVWIDSVVGEGTTVYLAFPRAGAPPEEGPTEVEPFSLPTRSLTILLAEDEATLRRTLSKALDAEGHHVLPAADGDSARAILDTRLEAVDLILSDIMMPGMSGVELAEYAHALRPDLPILLMSGYTAEDLGHLGRTVRFVSKPFELPTMLSIITAMTEAENRRTT